MTSLFPFYDVIIRVTFSFSSQFQNYRVPRGALIKFHVYAHSRRIYNVVRCCDVLVHRQTSRIMSQHVYQHGISTSKRIRDMFLCRDFHPIRCRPMDLQYSTTCPHIRNGLYPSQDTLVTSSCLEVLFRQGSNGHLADADEFKILALLVFTEKHTQKHAGVNKL